MQDLALKPWQIHRPTFDEKSKPEHSIYFSGAAVVPSIKPSSCWLRTRGSWSSQRAPTSPSINSPFRIGSVGCRSFKQASMQQQPELLTLQFTYLISSNRSFYFSGWAFYLPISFKPGLLLDRSPFPCDGWIRTWLLQVDPINQESSHLLTPRHPLNCVKPMPYNPSPFITFFFCWFCAHGFSFPSGDKKGSTIYNPNQFY